MISVSSTHFHLGNQHLAHINSLWKRLQCMLHEPNHICNLTIKMDLKCKTHMVLVCMFPALGKDVANFYPPRIKQRPTSSHWYVWHVYDLLDFLWGSSHAECKAAQTLEKGVCGKELFQQRHNWSLMTWKLPFTKFLSGQRVYYNTTTLFWG